MIILFLFLFSWQQRSIEGAANPGLQLAVTSKGIDYGKWCDVSCLYFCQKHQPSGNVNKSHSLSNTYTTQILSYTLLFAV